MRLLPSAEPALCCCERKEQQALTFKGISCYSRLSKTRYEELPRCCCTGVLCTRESDFYCCESLHSTLLRILGFFILAFASVAIWLYHRTIFALFGSVFGAGLHVPTLEAAARSAAETGSRRRPAGRGVLGWLWRLHYDWLDWNGLDKGAKLG